jgi:tetratricopeptide (TPR) repeat protein
VVEGTTEDATGNVVPNMRLQVVGPDVAPQDIHSDVDGRFSTALRCGNNYQFVVNDGRDSTMKTIVVSAPHDQIVLRVGAAKTTPPAGGTVSARSMMVPAKARKALDSAKSAFAKNRNDEGKAHLEKALAIDQCFAEALVIKASLELAKAPASAAEDMRRASACDPNYAPSYFGLAAAYTSLHRYDEAITTINTGLRLQPDAWQGHFEMGRALSRLTRYQDAAAQFARAEELLDGEFALLHAEFAWTLIRLGDRANAITELHRVLKERASAPLMAGAHRMLDALQSPASNPAAILPVPKH